MATQTSNDRRTETDAVNRHAGRAGAFALPGSGFQADRRRLFGSSILYFVPVFCLGTAVMTGNLQAGVVGIASLFGLLLLQDRWGLRRRAPGLGSERKATALLAWAVLVALTLAALWLTGMITVPARG